MSAARARRTARLRSSLFAGVALLVVGAFMVRLIDIQVVHADDYVQQSYEIGNMAGSRTLYAARGPIVDENGTLLATSIARYDASLDPSIIRSEVENPRAGDVAWPEMAARIGAIIGKSGPAVEKIVVDRLAEDPNAQWAELAKSLSAEQYQKLLDLDVNYLGFERHPARSYPNGAVAGNLTGFVGSDDTPLGGLELSYEQCMEGANGKESYLRGRYGELIPGSLRTDPAVDGGTLQLTINSDLQWYLRQMIAEEVQNQGAKSGTAMVVEVKTGKIRAAVEAPSVDPNDPTGVDPQYRGSRIFRDTFEPGSTFKAVTAAAVLEQGGITPTSTVTARSFETFPNGARISDAFSHPQYTYTLAGGLIDSSNIVLSKFSESISSQTLHDYLAKFGVGQTTAVNFQAEESGILHPADKWDNQSRYTASFGQSFTVTAPQVASVYQTIANGGLKMPLQLVEGCKAADGSVTKTDLPAPEQVIKPETSAQLRQMLENVAVQGELAPDVKIPGYRIATKTGTAEKVDPNTGAYMSGRYFTSLVGMAPAEDPQYVVVVTLDEPTRVTSSAAAAPAFQKAMTQTLKTFRVSPSTTPMGALLPKFG